MPLLGQALNDAVQASLRVADRIGIRFVDARVLRNSRHVSIHLHPSKVVARVARIDKPASKERIEREVAVGRHLAERAAPTISPVADFPAGPFFADGFGVTFWTYAEHVPANPENAAHMASAADALRRLHAALSDYPGTLPPLEAKIDECRERLSDPSALVALPSADRDFLLAVHEVTSSALEAEPKKAVPIHGDAGAHNVFITPAGARYGDFEAACFGPREWDIGFLPDIDLASFEPVNRDLLAILADLRSLCVSVWCWEKHEVPEMREAAQYHLEYLRERFAHRLSP